MKDFGFISNFVVYFCSTCITIHDIVNSDLVTDFIVFYFCSITIDDIVYVIDCGFVKVKDFNPEKGLQTLESFPVSRANAQQRKGRAGRYSVELRSISHHTIKNSIKKFSCVMKYSSNTTNASFFQTSFQ